MQPSQLLTETAHRPWPLSPGRWVMAQRWSELLFAHWPADPLALRALLPPGLELDLHGGEAWVGIVPFLMSGVRLAGLPAVPGTSTFPELNVRLYVRHGDRPGVWFLSLDAASRLAVRVARAWFHLPYFDARMGIAETREGIRYSSTRTHRGAPAAEFRATYAPVGSVERSAPGTLEHFLTERYCLYAHSPRRGLLRGEIHHAPWPLQRARARFESQSVARAAGLELHDTAPLLHFARSLEVLAWRPTPV